MATITTPASFAVSGGQGAGPDGTTTMTVRPDIIGSSSTTGSNLAFVVKDPTTGFLRPLTSAELASTFVAGGALNATTNFSLNATANVLGLQSANTLTLQSGAGIALANAFSTVANPSVSGINGVNPDILTETLTSGAVLAYSGNTGISVGALASPNTGYNFYTVGTGTNLSISGNLISGQAMTVTAVPLTAGDSTANEVVTLNSAEFYTGQTTVNGATLVLNGGNNTLVVVPTASTLSPANVALNGSGAVLDLNGNNQVIGTLLSSNPLPNMGGTLTNFFRDARHFDRG